jgi:hypothetical protein
MSSSFRYKFAVVADSPSDFELHCGYKIYFEIVTYSISRSAAPLSRNELKPLASAKLITAEDQERIARLWCLGA